MAIAAVALSICVGVDEEVSCALEPSSATNGDSGCRRETRDSETQETVAAAAVVVVVSFCVGVGEELCQLCTRATVHHQRRQWLQERGGRERDRRLWRRRRRCRCLSGSVFVRFAHKSQS